MTDVVHLDVKFGGFTEAGKRAYGLNDPVIIKEYQWHKGVAILARKDDRWLLSVCREDPRTHEPRTTVFGISEAGVNRDARELGLAPAVVARLEAEGMMRKWGWDG